MFYSIIGVIAIMIHLILNHEYFRNKEEKTDTNRAFKHYAWAALLYYVTDAFWGVIYDTHISTLIYINTILYYVAMAATVVLLCIYVTTYLKLNTGFGRFINYFGALFGVFEVTILIINHFTPVFFWLDESAVYHAGNMRYVALYIQVLLCVMLAIETGYVMNKGIGEMKKRYFTIFLFCVEMTAAIVTQIIYPLLPLYSIGLVVGISIIHTFVKEGEKEEQYRILSSLADIFYSVHVIDLVNDTVIEFNARDAVKEIVNRYNGAKDQMIKVISTVTVDEHRDAALDFTDLTTVSERMKGKKTISAQYVGVSTGWYLAMFIAIETDDEEKPTKVIFTTRVIEEEKRQEESLTFQARTDELTGLFNRRAYEEDIYEMSDIPEKFVYIALDVNGLKVVNDTIGHAAGDELITGASDCMKKILGPHGKLYRTGGDEFAAIAFVSEEEIKTILEEFEKCTGSWSGNLIDSLTVSYGYVSREEGIANTMPKYAVEADKRMYQAKAAYYRKKGVDRRGQQDAHRALCETYTKILKVNLSDDSYQIINMLEEERASSKGFSDSISTWLQEFGKSGQVHADDLESYLEKTNINYIRNYFKQKNSTLIILYRRKFGEVYKQVMMEMIPANDYSEDNQTIFLYVKNIEC